LESTVVVMKLTTLRGILNISRSSRRIGTECDLVTWLSEQPGMASGDKYRPHGIKNYMGFRIIMYSDR